MSTNRNKRSLTLDFTSTEGQEIARRLIAKSDIFIENFKVGTLAKYGLGYEQLKDDRPDLIYCSVTGFGQTGPEAQRPGYDFMIQGMGGFMSVTGAPDGEPQRAGVPIADLMTGMWTTVAVLAAIRHREVTGLGQLIDMSLLDCQVATMSNQAMNYLISGQVPDLSGNTHPNIVPYQVFATSDGNIILAIANDAQFKRFCDFAGVPQLAEDERFRTNDVRVSNRQAITDILGEIFVKKSSQYWLESLEAINISCGPINRMDQVFSDAQVLHRQMKIEMPHPLTGDQPVPLVGSPIKLSATPVSYRHSPPLLGENTDEVLEELLELDVEARQGLRERGVV
jgi:crotonobetainyl-CoA:carnitine CoA-transferase CaiB-like acyl-CoA transferase